MKHGFHPNMTMEAYHADRSSYSRSTIVQFAISPAHCRAYLDRTDEPKQDKFELGTAGHSAMVEGLETYMSRLAVVPEDVLGKNGARSTNAYKEWAAANKDKTILLPEQVERVKGMYRAVMKRSNFSKFLTSGLSEVSAFWPESDLDTGHHILCKCRPDKIPGQKVVFDLKTTSLNLDAWPRYAANSKAHWSAWLTCRGLTKLTGEKHTEYLFGVVETNPPHDARIYRTPRILFELAEYEIQELLPRLIECDRTNTWPGSDDEILDLVFPKWSMKPVEELMESF